MDDDGDGDEETEGLATVGLALVERELEGEVVGVLPPHDAAPNVAITDSTSVRIRMTGMLSVPT